MIDQNNKIIQELKYRPINENGYIHVARQNNYSDLIEETKKEIYNNKKVLKFESYVEWLENEALYKTYKAEWNDNQRKHLEKEFLKNKEVDDVYIRILEHSLALRERIIEKKEKQLKDTKEKLTTLKKEVKDLWR